ncbi:D-Ala-D-Ala carboxypeptidase family metallohydrolase [Bacillus sp. ISL-57]|uniref:D-Ala-D-Ala carboxypeptidase family metallohydrolase n=1 Tax=Bacillus sp. ISL-57 TaxID=2819135 RepID=UPI001BE5130D|nr:D-Ala-D-Ala carboxypeptidase family metallohydrolase [Bacillus sp. ISL-57]MBT2718081.1 hypothetical protein [Bacillus sp. ISL-57]
MTIQETAASRAAMQYGKSMGLTMTSGYRSPSKNASVGGGKNSMHQSGTAYDFAGSKAQMKAFANWAKNSGIFTEVLYETAGHYDHVHVGWGTGKHADGKTFVGDGKLIDMKEGSQSSTNGSQSGTGATEKIFGSSVKIILIALFIIIGLTFFIKAFPDAQAVVPTKQIKKIVKRKGKKNG